MKKVLFFISTIIVLYARGNRTTSNHNLEESKYGDWEICDFKDDFDEPTGEKYVRQIITGSFSNSATSSSPLKLYISIYLRDAYKDGDFKNTKKVLDGQILFDEYCNGTIDYKMYGDGSPKDEKHQSRFVDKVNHKAFHREDLIGLYFYEIEEKGKYYNWIQIFRDFPGTYQASINGKYNGMYRFTINTKKLIEALNDAGLIPDE